VTVRADVGSAAHEQTETLTLPETDGGNPEIERMWAWHRVQRLRREADRAGSPDLGRAEIVRLGEGFSIVTPHTSFLVLENDAEYRRWKIERRNALRLRRDRAKQQELASRLNDLRRKAATNLGPVDRTASASSRPTSAPVRASRPSQPASPSPRRSRPSSGGGSWGGGGAIDPVTGGVALAMAALAMAARRRGRGKRDGGPNAA
jgi:Ca-activated chloride channel family protein